MSSTAQGQHGFINYLNRLVEDGDRGALAALRRGLGRRPGDSPEAYPHVMPFNPPIWAERSYFLVASLFALWHQGSHSAPRGHIPANFGASFRDVAQQSESDGIERRFVAVLNAHSDDLPDHLRHAVSLMRSARRPVLVDWSRLLRDIQGWNWQSRSVQREWARGFWGQVERSADETNDEA